MKLTKRVVALLLTVMMVVTALSLGIFATEETTESNGVLRPIADTYVSSATPDAVYGDAETLYVNGSAKEDKVYLATFNTAELGDANKATLTLPVIGEGKLDIELYLINDYTVEETTLCYNEMPALTEANLIGKYTISATDNTINLLDLAARASGETFTIAIRGLAHYYELNFENYNVSEMVLSFDNGIATLYRTCYLDWDSTADENDYIMKEAGTPREQWVVADPTGGDNQVATLYYGGKTATATDGTMKYYNSLFTEAPTSADVGRIFNASFKVYTSSDAQITYGILAPTGNFSATSTSIAYGSGKVTIKNEDGWVTKTGTYKITDAMIKDTNAATAQYGMFSIRTITTTAEYYFDDIIVAEVTPTSLASRESTSATTAYITTETLPETWPVADTYVSRTNPDTAYGSEKTLLLGDAGGDKKLMVLSFKTKVLENGNYVLLDVPNSGSVLEDVSVFWINDYRLNEATLTYNELKKLNYETNLLGTYDLVSGTNKLDLSSIRDQLTGDYFTLVFRTEVHSYRVDFETYPTADTLTLGTSATSGTVGYSDTYFYRRGGELEANLSLAEDPLDSGNTVVFVNTKTATVAGRIRLFNALSYDALTDADVGKTYRFSFKILAKSEGAGTSNIVNYGVMAAATGTAWTTTEKNVNSISSKKWTELSVDYTVQKGDPALTNHPMFAIEFPKAASSAEIDYYLDDISVVEVVNGETVAVDASFASREDTDAVAPVRFVSALDGNVTVLETTVSSATTGDVFSIVDGDNTYSLLSVDNNKNLIFKTTGGTTYTLCDYQGTAYILDANEVKIAAIYDDTEGTVRFAVGDSLACYEAGKVTFGHKVIDGGVSENALVGTEGVKASLMATTTSELVGYQKNNADDKSVRFLSGVDWLYYTAIGFEVERDGVKLERESTSPYVFESVSIGDDSESAKNYGYNYMTALIIENITSGGVLKVTPYVKVGNNVIKGTSAYYKITTNDGLTIEKTTESTVALANNADLASLTVDGSPVVGFSAGVTEYNVPAADPSKMTIEAVTAEEGATFSVEQSGNIATVTVTSFNGKATKEYTLTAYEKLASEVVNKNGAKAIVTYVFDDGDRTTATIVTKELSPLYDSLTGSFALITKDLATLSTVKSEVGDGLLEYEKDANGNYVYTKNETNWNYWQPLLDTYKSRGFEAVSHTHTHAYIGENDNGGSFEYRNVNGVVFTSAVFPKGNITKEYYASNQILRELGQRAYAMVGAGLTAGGYKIDYTDSYKAFPQTSGAFIGKRTTYTYPKTPEVMVNKVTDFVNEDNRFNVLSYMVEHYNTSAVNTTNSSSSAADCLAAGINYWTGYIDTAVDMGGWAVFCFHNIRPDDFTGNLSHFVYQSQASALFKHSDDLSKTKDVWVANLTDAMLYVFERSTSEVGAYMDGDKVVVSLDDHEDDAIFNMALTVKVALPEGKSGATLDGTALTTFTENEVTYVYVDIVPGNSVTLTVNE